MKTIMFIVVFLLVGAFFIISNENIKLNSTENINLFIEEYGNWMDNLLENGRTVVGYVVKMGWLPESSD